MRYILPALMALVLTAGPVMGNIREKTIGTGIAVGDLSGISIKTWRAEDTAIDAVLSWWGGELKFSVNFLKHFFDIIDNGQQSYPLYYGFGTRVRIRDDDPDKSTVGLRFPGGISYIFPEAPMDAFLEVAPVVGVVPDTAFEFTAMTGLRYYF